MDEMHGDTPYVSQDWFCPRCPLTFRLGVWQLLGAHVNCPLCSERCLVAGHQTIDAIESGMEVIPAGVRPLTLLDWSAKGRMSVEGSPPAKGPAERPRNGNPVSPCDCGCVLCADGQHGRCPRMWGKSACSFWRSKHEHDIWHGSWRSCDRAGCCGNPPETRSLDNPKSPAKPCSAPWRCVFEEGHKGNCAVERVKVAR